MNLTKRELTTLFKFYAESLNKSKDEIIEDIKYFRDLRKNNEVYQYDGEIDEIFQELGLEDLNDEVYKLWNK